MSENRLTNIVYQQMKNLLDSFEKNPDSVSEEDIQNMESLYSKLCKRLGISEHSQWRVEWQVEKWADTARKIAGFSPDEVVCAGQNIILDTGANEMLKLITGTGGTAFNASNSYIYVGTDSTAENASQTGVISTGANRAYAGMDTGYPMVSSRQMIYRASFGDTSANFAWNEAAILNGTGANAVAMNRKVSTLGTKASGTWTLQITISLTSA